MTTNTTRLYGRVLTTLALSAMIGACDGGCPRGTTLEGQVCKPMSKADGVTTVADGAGTLGSAQAMSVPKGLSTAGRT